MSHWKIKAAAAVLLLAGALIAVRLATVKESDPLYKGKPLSQHLHQVQEAGFSVGGLPIVNGDFPEIPLPPRVQYQCGSVDALDALSIQGTNAIPMLMRMLKAEDSKIRTWLFTLSQRHSFVGKLIYPQPPSALAEEARAAAVFYRLGPSAVGAAPYVLPLLKSGDHALAALAVLSSIRPTNQSEILAMTNVLSIRADPIRRGPLRELHAAALLALASFGPQAQGASEVLMQSLTSTNSIVRAAAAVALTRMRTDPGKVVPHLLNGLRVSDEGSLALTLWALGEQGRHARAALPILAERQLTWRAQIQMLASRTVARINKDVKAFDRRENQPAAGPARAFSDKE